jgi:hypothetical protein
MTWGDDDQGDELELVCLSCLIRPPRPGSVYCSRLCAVMGRLRRLWAEAEQAQAELPRPAGL